jgi:predicted pyridoxine 5'-phosphate oxidase superfamily flavin-nucleotide-binding protein
MPKGVRKNAEDIVKGIIENQRERIRKIKEKDREKLKKMKALLDKEKQARRIAVGVEMEKLYREQGSSMDMKKVAAICEKYWPSDAVKTVPSE